MLESGLTRRHLLAALAGAGRGAALVGSLLPGRRAGRGVGRVGGAIVVGDVGLGCVGHGGFLSLKGERPRRQCGFRTTLVHSFGLSWKFL